MVLFQHSLRAVVRIAFADPAEVQSHARYEQPCRMLVWVQALFLPAAQRSRMFELCLSRQHTGPARFAPESDQRAAGDIERPVAAPGDLLRALKHTIEIATHRHRR